MHSIIYFVGIERLIDHLLKHKVPIAVATGNSEYEFSLKEKGHSEFFKKIPTQGNFFHNFFKEDL